MLALSIRQPYAELILRGIKTAELRSRATKRIGERFYIYASKGRGVRGEGRGKEVWSNDLSVANAPEWMIELAEQVKIIKPGEQGGLPTGVIVGSAVIEGISLAPNPSPLAPIMYRWHLTDVMRAKRLRKPQGHPQPVWFRPFG